ncbi:MAG: hypothetical protein MK324_10905 [Pirellulales bacterium]|nr:hypothetical protein [Pirellulales bacterium]
MIKSLVLRPIPQALLGYTAICCLLGILPLICQSADEQEPANRSLSIDSKLRQSILKDLPAIQIFKTTPSSRFLVDLDVVSRGHPYIGRRAERPHTGGHVYFNPRDKKLSRDVSEYPPIYAVADGVITRIDYSFELRPMFERALGRDVANRRYGIGLTFAREQERGVTFHYSIEPFVRPKDPDFYDQFILVKLGQKVRKGEVIARMYLPENQELAKKSHIHFNLIREGGGGFISPSIFNNATVRAFHKRWNLFPNNPDAPIPPCMGYKLAPDENPFERTAIDRL